MRETGYGYTCPICTARFGNTEDEKRTICKKCEERLIAVRVNHGAAERRLAHREAAGDA